jgi:hypothetical protein
MTQHRRSDRPEAMLIATEATQIELRDALADLGFVVITPRSLLAAYAQMRRLLAPARSARRILILVDMTVIDPGFPEFPGMLLAAVVSRQMQLGRLQTAWLVGVITDNRSEGYSNATVAGCQQIIDVPLALDDRLALRSLVEQPAPPPYGGSQPQEADALLAFQSLARRVMRAVHAAQTHPWTPDDVSLVLCWLTPYPVWSSGGQQADLSAEAALRIQQLLRALGGPRAARQRFEAIVAQWRIRFALHGDILRKFLDGWERREIVRYFVEHGLYEDSRVYHCIKELPRRIAEQLRREQASLQDPLDI